MSGGNFCAIRSGLFAFSLRVMFDEPPCVTETGVENHSIYCCVGSSWTLKSVTKQINLCETYVVSGAYLRTILYILFQKIGKVVCCERRNEFACETCEVAISASEQCRLILWQLA